jgi:hypothetical protein
MAQYSFQTAFTQARELYGVDIAPDELETIGIIAWDKIGNKPYRLYKYQVVPSLDALGQYYVDLPCNCDQIEAITTNYEDYQKTNPMTIAMDNQNGWMEGYAESRKFNTGSLYMGGKFVKYRQELNRIFISDKFDVLNILYKGFIADEEGLPYLNEKEVDAIATFIAYSDMFKKALMTRDSASLQLSQLLEQQWRQKCTQARVPIYINQNEMDEILNVSTSWDRKRFGKSFKPTR